MSASEEFNIMHLYEKTDQLGDKAIALLMVISFYFSPHYDGQMKSEEPLGRLFLMLENQTSKMFKIILNFEKKNKVSLPNYRTNMIDEVDLNMISIISSLSLLVDCYSRPGGMPFSRIIIHKLLIQLIQDIERVVKEVERYCNKVNKELKTTGDQQ